MRKQEMSPKKNTRERERERAPYLIKSVEERCRVGGKGKYPPSDGWYLIKEYFKNSDINKIYKCLVFNIFAIFSLIMRERERERVHP